MLWSSAKACQFLGISARTLRRWRAQNPEQLGACRPVCHWRYDVAKIKALANPRQAAVDAKRNELLGQQ